MATQNPQFSCFTLNILAASAFVSDNGSDGQTVRRRKVHAKSKLGCSNCKARRVKCDEKQPCGHCVKRNDICSVASARAAKVKPTINSSKNSIVSMSAKQPDAQQTLQSLPSLEHSQSSPINLQHLRLLHHFENHTYKTFIMDPQFWKMTVVHLALQNPFLMHAVFLVTASHLQHLYPHDSQYSRMVSLQLSEALPSFRTALDTLTTNKPDNGDALMACSMLLLQFSWEFTSTTIQDTHTEDAGWHTMLGLYSGVRNIIFQFWDMKSDSSRFADFLTYSPRRTIDRYFENTAMSLNIEACFNHCLTCTKISNDKGKDLEYCVDASRVLISIWCALKMGLQCLENSNLLLDVARCLFSWPAIFPPKFYELSKATDQRCLVIILYYFAAVSRLRCERFWWMHKRAVHMFKTLFARLEGECDECTGMARELFDEGDSV